jgi:photosystem II stability/assembly factor-like uncharacterized protein
MRALLLFVLVLTACTNLPGASTTPTPASSGKASPSPIVLPSFAQLSAPSGTVVWALVAGTRLFRSSDRGDTWVERTLPPALVNVEIAFADDTNGVLLSPGSPATSCQTQTASIWRTADGAASWQQVTATGIADAMCKRGLTVGDTTRAFFTAYGPSSGPVIYRTADGGRTWTASKPLPDPPGFTFTTPGGVVILPGRPHAFGSVILVDAQGYGEQKRYVFRSTDGGATFTYASTVPAVEGAVAVVTATRWLLIAPPGSSMETTDGGATWHKYTTDYSQAAPITADFAFGHADFGYATVRGAIQRTMDSGAHWTVIKTPGTG